MLIQLLGMKFKAINDTEALFEQAKGESNNFDELISALRQKLAQREYVQEQDANHQSQVNSTTLNAVNNNTTYNDSGWRVEQKLWEILPPEIKKDILARRREKLRERNPPSTSSPNEKIPSHLTTTDTIVKKLESKDLKEKIPKQYKSNKAVEETNETSFIEDIMNMEEMRESKSHAKHT